jgi:hypothetical protein
MNEAEMPEIKVGCLCGAVHYTAQAPEVVVVCHCRIVKSSLAARSASWPGCRKALSKSRAVEDIHQSRR